MAISGRTTTAEMDDVVYSAIIREAILAELRDQNLPEELIGYNDISNKPSKAMDIPVWSSVSAAAIVEGSDLSNTALATTKVTLTAAEVGIMALVTDLLQASDVLDGLDEYKQPMARAMATKWNSDLTALFAALNGGTVLGNCTIDLGLSNFLSAIYNLEINNAPAGRVAVLHPIQVHSLRAAIVSSANAVWGDAVHNRIPGSGQHELQAGTLFDVPVYQTGNVRSSVGAREGAVFTRGSNGAFGQVSKWGLRVELQRDASARATEVVVTRCYGIGEVRDKAGICIKSDADYDTA